MQGVQQRPDLSVIYINEVKLDGMPFSIQLKLEDVYKVQNMVTRQFPKVRIPLVPYYKNTRDRIDPKMIQLRGVQIQNLLIQLLTCSSMFDPNIASQQKVQKILGQLGINRRFYQGGSRDSIPSDRMSMDGSALAALDDEYNIPVNIICPHMKLEVMISEDTTASELVNRIGQALKLKETDDFKLVSTGENARILQEEEIVYNILKDYQKGMFGWIKLNLTDNKLNTLHFRKFLYFSRDSERNKYTSDEVRCQLQTCQVLEEIKSGKIHLSPYEVTEILSPYLCIQRFRDQKEI